MKYIFSEICAHCRCISWHTLYLNCLLARAADILHDNSHADIYTKQHTHLLPNCSLALSQHVKRVAVHVHRVCLNAREVGATLQVGNGRPTVHQHNDVGLVVLKFTTNERESKVRCVASRTGDGLRLSWRDGYLDVTECISSCQWWICYRAAQRTRRNLRSISQTDEGESKAYCVACRARDESRCIEDLAWWWDGYFEVTEYGGEMRWKLEKWQCTLKRWQYEASKRISYMLMVNIWIKFSGQRPRSQKRSNTHWVPCVKYNQVHATTKKWLSNIPNVVASLEGTWLLGQVAAVRCHTVVQEWRCGRQSAKDALHIGHLDGRGAEDVKIKVNDVAFRDCVLYTACTTDRASNGIWNVRCSKNDATKGCVEHNKSLCRETKRNNKKGTQNVTRTR